MCYSKNFHFQLSFCLLSTSFAGSTKSESEPRPKYKQVELPKEEVQNSKESTALETKPEGRLYFQGPDYTINLIPIAVLIKGLIILGK